MSFDITVIYASGRVETLRLKTKQLQEETFKKLSTLPTIKYVNKKEK